MANFFTDRYVGLGDSGGEDEVKQEMNTYRLREASRADAEGSRQETWLRRADEMYSWARAQVSSGDTKSPVVKALAYSETLADITSLTRAGNYVEAQKKFAWLDKDESGEDFVTYRSIATTRPDPSDPFSVNVNTGSSNLVNKRFYDQVVRLPDGNETTLGSIYRDGAAFKNFYRDQLVKKNFTQGFASAFQEEAPRDARPEDAAAFAFKREVFSRVADAGMDAKNAGKAPVYREVGDYLSREWENMVSELGQRGTRTLVDDVLANHVDAMTAVDFMDNVRDNVDARRWGANGGSTDRSGFVGQTIRQFNRMRATGGGDAKSLRLDMKLISAALDGQKAGAFSLDFDDPRAQDAMDGLRTIFSSADKGGEGVQLMSKLTNLGVDVRAMASSYVRDVVANGRPSESNTLVQVQKTMELSRQLFSSEWIAVEKDKDSKDAYQRLSDGMETDILKEALPLQANGLRSDLACKKILTDPNMSSRLAVRWAQTIAARTGLSDMTAVVLSSRVAREMVDSGSGGLRAVDIPKMLATMAFDHSVPDDVRKELLLRQKGDMAREALRPLEKDYAQLLADPVIGKGLSPAEIRVELDRVARTEAIPRMNNGRSPEAMYKVLSSFAPVYFATGRMLVPGVADPVDLKEYEAAVKAAEAKNIARLKSHGNLPVSADALKNARPEVFYSGSSVDLDKVSIKGVPGSAFSRGIGSGSWTSNRMEFMDYQAYLKSIAISNMKAAQEAATRGEEQAEPSR